MKKFLFVSKVTVLVFLIIAVAFFVFRGKLFNYLFSSFQNNFSQKYNCELKIEESSMTGVFGFSLKGLSLIPAKQDTLLTLKTFEGDISFEALLTGNIKFNSISINDGKLNAVEKNGKNNFSFLFKEKAKVDTNNLKADYGKIAHRLMNAVFSKVPDIVQAANFKCTYTDSLGSSHFDIVKLNYEDEIIKGKFLVGNNDNNEKWNLNGKLDKRLEILEGKIFADTNAVQFPFIDKRYNMHLGFDTAYFSLSDNNYEDEALILKGKIYANNFKVKHPRIDSNFVSVKNAGADYLITIGKRSSNFELPSLNINKITFDLKAAYSNDTTKKYLLQANMKRMSSQEFFNSLPEGLFSTFEGIKVSGDLEYHLDFELDRSRPDCVKFESRLLDYKFAIKKFGTVNFSKMSEPFVYTAYEKDRAVRSFVVGSENPMFTPTDQISEYLKAAVLQSEDGSFFWHKGFREDAFRKALADNVKQGRFARGGSTISMQLVKNVFLSRKKTIARKLEEALIVWLIERNRLTTKERMYEVYLNVIEWGPMIYGVKEAAHFYFDKSPSDLTIEESIFMASIIPRPKAFKYSFDDQGNLKPYLESYYNKLSEILVRREKITEEQRAMIVPNVKLKGPARFAVVKDTIVSDTLDVEDDIF